MGYQTEVRPFSVGPYQVGSGQPLLLIAGPCVLENDELCLEIARKVQAIGSRCGMNVVFKGSFDKANRTSGSAFRGLGMEAGLEILARVAAETGLPVTTDIHESYQAAPVAEVCDLLQIPAFLARQTDLLVAAARTQRAVHVKKGQFMAPTDMAHVVAKLRDHGCDNILLGERGTFFGYGRLVNDFRSLPVMRGLGVGVVFDATHSVQEPGGLGGATGEPRNGRTVGPRAVSIGIDALFLETHPDPARSPSDGPNMVPLDDLEPLLQRLAALRGLVTSW